MAQSNRKFEVDYAARNRTITLQCVDLVSALRFADSLTQATHIPASVTRNGSLIYDAAVPAPVYVRHV